MREIHVLWKLTSDFGSYTITTCLFLPTFLNATQPHPYTRSLVQRSHTRKPDETQQRQSDKLVYTHGTSSNSEGVLIATNSRPRGQLVPQNHRIEGFGPE